MHDQLTYLRTWDSFHQLRDQRIHFEPLAAGVMSTTSCPPFGVRLLGNTRNVPHESLLPAATRTSTDDIRIPTVTLGDLGFLSKELLVDRLNDVHGFLWMAGRPMPARHLGHQILLSREVVVVENMDLHLVWKAKRIFIKPLPRYLLEEEFWEQHLIPCSQDDAMVGAQRQRIAQCARGLLLSYCALLSYESDFNLARTLGLLPNDVQWEQWRTWVAQVIANCPYESVNQRFWYGELRLGRLNTIYRWRKGYLLRGYSTVGSPSVYSEFLTQNFAALAVVLGYIVVALTAMQVGLATNHLQQSTAFQGASWVFTMISILAPLAAAALVLTCFLVVFIANWVATTLYERERSKTVGFQIRGANSPVSGSQITSTHIKSGAKKSYRTSPYDVEKYPARAPNDLLERQRTDRATLEPDNIGDAVSPPSRTASLHGQDDPFAYFENRSDRPPS